MVRISADSVGAVDPLRRPTTDRPLSPDSEKQLRELKTYFDKDPRFDEADLLFALRQRSFDTEKAIAYLVEDAARPDNQFTVVKNKKKQQKTEEPAVRRGGGRGTFRGRGRGGPVEGRRDTPTNGTAPLGRGQRRVANGRGGTAAVVETPTDKSVAPSGSAAATGAKPATPAAKDQTPTKVTAPAAPVVKPQPQRSWADRTKGEPLKENIKPAHENIEKGRPSATKGRGPAAAVRTPPTAAAAAADSTTTSNGNSQQPAASAVTTNGHAASAAWSDSVDEEEAAAPVARTAAAPVAPAARVAEVAPTPAAVEPVKLLPQQYAGASAHAPRFDFGFDDDDVATGVVDGPVAHVHVPAVEKAAAAHARAPLSPPTTMRAPPSGIPPPVMTDMRHMSTMETQTTPTIAGKYDGMRGVGRPSIDAAHHHHVAAPATPPLSPPTPNSAAGVVMYGFSPHYGGPTALGPNGLPLATAGAGAGGAAAGAGGAGPSAGVDAGVGTASHAHEFFGAYGGGHGGDVAMFPPHHMAAAAAAATAAALGGGVAGLGHNPMYANGHGGGVFADGLKANSGGRGNVHAPAAGSRQQGGGAAAAAGGVDRHGASAGAGAGGVASPRAAPSEGSERDGGGGAAVPPDMGMWFPGGPAAAAAAYAAAGMYGPMAGYAGYPPQAAMGYAPHGYPVAAPPAAAYGSGGASSPKAPAYGMQSAFPYNKAGGPVAGYPAFNPYGGAAPAGPADYSPEDYAFSMLPGTYGVPPDGSRVAGGAPHGAKDGGDAYAKQQYRQSSEMAYASYLAAQGAAAGYGGPYYAPAHQYMAPPPPQQQQQQPQAQAPAVSAGGRGKPYDYGYPATNGNNNGPAWAQS